MKRRYTIILVLFFTWISFAQVSIETHKKQIQKGTRTIALNKTTNQLYLPTVEFGAKPEPTTENPKPRASLIPNSSAVLVIENNIIYPAFFV